MYTRSYNRFPSINSHFSTIVIFNKFLNVTKFRKKMVKVKKIIVLFNQKESLYLPISKLNAIACV